MDCDALGRATRQLLLDEEFNTLERHWAEIMRRSEVKFALGRQQKQQH
jgi:hypothetical protein